MSLKQTPNRRAFIWCFCLSYGYCQRCIRAGVEQALFAIVFNKSTVDDFPHWLPWHFNVFQALPCDVDVVVATLVVDAHSACLKAIVIVMPDGGGSDGLRALPWPKDVDDEVAVGAFHEDRSI